MALEKDIRRTAVLSIMNGAIFNFAFVFIDPNTVLALFIATTTGSEALVGVIAAIAAMGQIIPQMFVASRVAGAERKLRYYHISFAIRGPALLSMVAAVVLVRDAPILVAGLVMLTYGVFAFGGGLAFVPFMEIVGNTIPPSRRSTFFALRSFLGLMLGIAAGYIVRLVLASPGRFPFPENYLTLFGLGTCLALVAMACFSIVKEPIIDEERRVRTLRQTLHSAREIISTDSAFRRYLVARSLIVLASLSTPFYILYATRNLGLGEGAAGILIMSMTAGGILSYLVWGRVGDAKGTRILILMGAVLLALVPASALFSNLWRTLPAAMFTFTMLGLANAGINIGVTSYLLDHCETSTRPVYVATTNMVVGVFSAAPLVGGLIAEAYGHNVLFIISLIIALMSTGFALRLPEPRGVAEQRFRALVRIS